MSDKELAWAYFREGWRAYHETPTRSIRDLFEEQWSKCGPTHRLNDDGELRRLVEAVRDQPASPITTSPITTSAPLPDARLPDWYDGKPKRCPGTGEFPRAVRTGEVQDHGHGYEPVFLSRCWWCDKPMPPSDKMAEHTFIPVRAEELTFVTGRYMIGIEPTGVAFGFNPRPEGCTTLDKCDGEHPAPRCLDRLCHIPSPPPPSPSPPLLSRTVVTYKAQQTGGQVVPDLHIVARQPIPSREHPAGEPLSQYLAELAAEHEREATQIVDALCGSLPGGTLDRLVGILLLRKASHFVVPYARPLRTGYRDDAGVYHPAPDSVGYEQHRLACSVCLREGK